jgi:hypothetical protein
MFVLVRSQNLGCSYHLVVFVFVFVSLCSFLCCSNSMFKLSLKLQPLKNFKYKYMFGDIFIQGDGASSIHSIDHNDVLTEVFSNVEPHYMNVDPILTQDNELN